MPRSREDHPPENSSDNQEYHFVPPKRSRHRMLETLQGMAEKKVASGKNSSVHRTVQRKSQKNMAAGGYRIDMSRYNFDRDALPIPDVSAVFERFQPRETPRTFKSEPIEPEEWKAELARQKQEAIDKKQRPKQAREEARVVGPEARRAISRGMFIESAVDDSVKGHTRNKQISRPRAQSIVDLTDDVEDMPISSTLGEPTATLTRPVSQTSPHTPARAIRRPNPPKYRKLTPAQTQMMDRTAVPTSILQQARDAYMEENIHMPDDIKTWIEFKSFAARNPIPRVRPALVVFAQTHTFRTAPCRPPQRTHSVVHEEVLENDLDQATAIPSSPIGIEQEQPTTTTLEEMRQIKLESEEHEQNRGLRQEAPAFADSTYSQVESEQSMGKKTSTATQFNHDAGATHTNQDAPLAAADSSNLSDAEIRDLVTPIGYMPDILPLNAPEGHAHLIALWKAALLDLPLNKHDHLTLPDTVVSILAKYDLYTQSAVKAFLDLEGTSHFFFLFKARNNHLHSWSIEREDNIVTIGIENWKRSRSDQGASSGQFNLTIQYRVLPASPSAPLDALSISNHGEQVSRCQEDDEQPEENEIEAAPRIPGLWTLYNLTIIPSNPDLYTYLYHTPASRGADTHTLVSHPTQSHLLPPDDLSTFARYLQHTFCTSKVMDAEVQVAWGRKVRYDNILGRVRPVWDNALKGAKTQKLKRERGEYNRPTVSKSSAKRVIGYDGHDHPNASEGKAYLGKLKRGASMMDDLDGSTAVDLDSLPPAEFDEAAADESQGGGGADVGVQERVKKRPKLGTGDEIESESSDSGSD
ncbi:hypothetical protein LTR64_007963 [Lithohypha guttulata]|uniref:uncharacterized protein n=1 Tax=Lithohypha guttulata TaxID=1690604 RepID=UPI002DE11B1A|nr:hypothetical protein LTR51_008168 [Lithohypha guttulata]